MLHTLINSPFYSDMNTLLLILDIGDDIILLQDGVIAALKGNLAIEKILNTNKSIRIYVLEEDLIARGLIKQISTKVYLVNYNGFVKLTEKHKQQMMW
ncbi:sulfurtransferase complex subunit TusB [Candidatus Pantoea edessiphila]|uniref:Protein TusB n=1 Tax=Candidatus Pantoea edessiphila TaxID=2044610 RepID=A0A2P5SXU9_9GAMM|nr:sulfurtransferase complex subunit TusB [Candidatus Pantoea edessiphila]MBK4775772.1 sulfurtransferase complex subunit TusB [Pantoea sp. Edef]PPI87168.1 sulfurtransferase complex subunit TusB [Candidatus Pantoea edessiphila]